LTAFIPSSLGSQVCILISYLGRCLPLTLSRSEQKVTPFHMPANLPSILTHLLIEPVVQRLGTFLHYPPTGTRAATQAPGSMTYMKIMRSPLCTNTKWESREGQGREGALTLSCARVTWPTTTLGFPEPLATPAAFCRRTDAGGVFRMKVKLRSCTETQSYLGNGDGGADRTSILHVKRMSYSQATCRGLNHEA
jgi:hypothetical protein